MRELVGIVGLLGAVVLTGCPPRALDAPPTGLASAPVVAAPAAPGPASAPRARDAAPPAAEGGDLVAVPPWVDLHDPKDHAWVDGMRRAVRAVAPEAAKCREGTAAAVPACLCKVICTVKFPPLKQREGFMEISYPPLPGGGPGLRSFRLKPDGAVESCTFRGGDPDQPGARTTEIVWCAEETGAKKP
jgi:hypothetical protein